ncbi:polyribonucleotide nucleotidyltransferase [Geotalea daltonii FRC-32]|uniref:Polyribonucleotide nucleotidyltransferase n=1 Tax=Geotalea daltonii (strain DSM 22248 / JCM 15807 / FRC-32) TaxID=316067 RepID=PNP_GEODF|nr:polyribonucleotide nucleotidyltransferase [Geotalea daltonii]B9M1G5.1 RecName: Full=Polyribonucleotide nucleotidyltransferase; AltName: Full=Polynucleotide phosphorylase; Short=PNPase [Geotalea daltonii FRC-32]ACM21047.1 polyribonucleotide nucleotidyltransferase [Geotalea daltonii FRC-32]
METKVQVECGGRTITIETGKMAKQASGAVVVSSGDTRVLVTAVATKTAKEGQDFFPLTVNYQEKAYAGGKIPGGFFKREARPSDNETLTCRLIDRPIRPLFPDNFLNDTQIMATVISADKDNDPGILSMVGASAALMVSDIPFQGPIAGVKVGRIDGRFVANPGFEEMEKSDIEIVVAASKDAIIMVEGSAAEVSEEDMLEAIFFGHAAIQGLLAAQVELAEKAGVAKREVLPPVVNEALKAKVKELAYSRMKEAVRIKSKVERHNTIDTITGEVLTALAEEFEGAAKEIKGFLGDFEYDLVREHIIKDGERIDGRDTKTIRQITTEVGLLPRAHGSALFTRGETQALVVATLGTSIDEQRIDSLFGESKKRFLLHYNFPPFSVGETSFRLAPGRREIGHGMLAERALARVVPKHESFPYTIRIVSDILESNGSSSMASVCGGSMSMMDAGIPIKAPVAGIAMGLIKEGDDFAILSDILGDEDHLGDMDFKVAGTSTGVTALQMDIKIGGVTREIMGVALKQAHEGRLHILSKMAETIGTSKAELSTFAPRITTIYVKTDKIRDVIGSGGKNIRGITEATGVTIDIDDTGKINIASTDKAACDMAIKMIRDLTAEAEEGKLYMGLVKKVMEFGAFVEIFPGTDGLVHISELDTERVKNVTDVLKEGDKVLVKCIGIDKQGKIKLSRKEALGASLPE